MATTTTHPGGGYAYRSPLPRVAQTSTTSAVLAATGPLDRCVSLLSGAASSRATLSTSAAVRFSRCVFFLTRMGAVVWASAAVLAAVCVARVFSSLLLWAAGSLVRGSMSSGLTRVLVAVPLSGPPSVFWFLDGASSLPLVGLEFRPTQASAAGRAPGVARACECCRCDHDGGYGSGRFCSVHCARRVAASRKWAKRRLSAVRFFPFHLLGGLTWLWGARACASRCCAWGGYACGPCYALALGGGCATVLVLTR